MGAIESQITSLTIVHSTVYSDADQRKHQTSASLAFVRGIHLGPVNSPHKWPVTRKMFPFDDVIMSSSKATEWYGEIYHVKWCYIYNNNIKNKILWKNLKISYALCCIKSHTATKQLLRYPLRYTIHVTTFKINIPFEHSKHTIRQAHWTIVYIQYRTCE